MTLNQYNINSKLTSNEQVLFFDGSVSTPFPKFTAKQKLTKQMLVKIRSWVLTNTYNVSVKRGDRLYVIDAQEGLHIVSKGVPQAIMDSCSYYLADGG